MDSSQEKRIDFALPAYKEPKNLKRRDETIDFSGLIGLTQTDRFRKGDQLLDTDPGKYDLGEVGRINMNTHRILTTIIGNNSDTPGIVIKTSQGSAYFETGNGFKAMDRQGAFQESQKVLNGSLELRQKKIVSFLKERFIEQIEKGKTEVIFTFSELADLGLGIEPLNFNNLSKKQAECRTERHEFMRMIEKLTEEQVQEVYKDEKSLMFSAWGWDYEKGELTVMVMDEKKLMIRI